MADNKQDSSPFADDGDTATQLLQGLISPAPAQALVAPPPDSAPKTGPGESTPLTGSLAAAPSQATPKVAPLPGTANATLASAGPAPTYDAARAAQLQQARNADAAPLNPYQSQYQPGLGVKIRRGLAGYFSGGIGGALNTNYNAPNKSYAVDEANRQARLGQDEANLADLNKGYDEGMKSYQSSLAQAKNAILLQRNNQLQQARQQNAGIRQQVADARQEAADTQRQLAQAKVGAATAPAAQPGPAAPAPLDSNTGNDAGYVKVLSNGQVGYLPKANLAEAQQRDKNLKVLK